MSRIADMAGPIQTFSEFEAILGRHWDVVVLPDTLDSAKASHHNRLAAPSRIPRDQTPPST
jgi:hypothetical protein